ncbi:hypothetical protein IW492_06250 [Enterococcus sp. BWB1-3]|uniref:hypothetical protein n=1 Tax=unclassified Enterococcus TaxID=2608891 RepID=UPI001923509C|nr:MULTISPECIES: hypothetical protein [unclassified Enterococcus]MBL1228834.1 hypothetical protein [Enterococcus sp. BWB1-3]MCB5951624.1 hypothetical protein [Enterococcus sp. BWT-B8]MCB5954716.1 hypothetical protein [Enterococcus sp. CWB-B31]
MSEAFDVFFHQKAIPDYLGTTIYENSSADELLVSCEGIYSRVTGSSFSPMEEQKVVKQLQNSQKNRDYLEIQFFQVQLDEEALLDELKELFPQFLWTKMSEEIEAEFSTYACEFIPIAIRDESYDTPIYFNIIESLQQMKGNLNESISEMLEKHLDEILNEEDDSGSAEELSFPVNVTIDETPEEDDYEYEPVAASRKSRKSRKNSVDLPAVRKSSENSLARTEESEIVYLKESLKREKASKERVRVAKEKLEHELLAIENSLLVSGLKRFKKHRKITVDEEDWYKPVKIDLIHYDDLYKKAKFIEQSWKLNKELVTITEKMIVTKDELTYERERVERIKNSVSEMDLQSMMEQCHLINNRVRINRGFLFIKPSVKLYQIDYEQLEKISGFFDVIQTENRLLEQIILNQDNDNK